MTTYLVFTLAAPIASFGAIAVGERRPTWDRPSKSQILGLVAGCIGIERSEESRHLALANSYAFAVRVDAAGLVMTDYHTTQVPTQRRNRRFATRSDELSVDQTDLKTILSRREFRAGSLYTVALSTIAPEPPHTLEQIATALQKPAFVPFAGRKANALILPMAPRVVNSEDIVAAFAAYDSGETKEQRALRAQCWLVPTEPDGRIYADAGTVPRQFIDRIEQRRDVPESRGKWRFGLRSEAMLKRSMTGDTK